MHIIILSVHRTGRNNNITAEKTAGRIKEKYNDTLGKYDAGEKSY